MDWKPTLMVCLVCDDKFYSKHEGHVAWCKCGESAVEESNAYLRTVGEARKVYSGDET